MNLIICMGQDGEMLFNNRRVVQDIAVLEDMVDSIYPNMIYMSAYSATLFATDFTGELFSVKDIENVGADEWYYCEAPRELTSEIIAKVNQIMIYRWNRTYPKEECFNPDVLDDFQVLETTPCKYDRITSNKIKIAKSVYKRK